MKHKILPFLLFLLPFCAKAQYTGGPGDGYASASVSALLSVNGETERKEAFSVYPNPVQSGQSLLIQGTGQTADAVHLSLCDLSGRVMAESELRVVQGASVQWTPPVLPAGMYVLCLQMTDGSTRYTQLMVKE